MTLERRWNCGAHPKAYQERSLDAMAKHVEGMLRLQKMGSITFDYGNNIRTFAFQRGVKNAYDFPGFVPAYIRPLFCEGRGPFRWVALSGEASDIAITAISFWSCSPRIAACAAGLNWLGSASSSRDCLPRICCWDMANSAIWLAINDLVKKG